MLKISFDEKERKIEEPCVLVLGGFDGLHEGHKSLLKKAREFSYSVAMMTIFDGKGSKNLFTAKEREESFEKAGIDFLLACEFSSIREMEAEDFLDKILSIFRPVLVVCGEDFRFGKGAKGTPKTIEKKLPVFVEKLLLIEGEKVSSSLVKRRIEVGDLEGANKLLGSPFFLKGVVEKGRGVGRKLGFPTANLTYPQEKFPLPLGVYETEIEVEGKSYRGITNYGARPTFLDDEVLTESYLHAFSGDLYGKELKISFLRYLRKNRKFEKVEDLIDQLKEDVRSIEI